MRTMNILIISAHPDDDVIGIGGIIQKMTLMSSTNIHSVILSKGCEGYDETTNDQIITEIRQSECNCAHRELHIQVTKILDYPDCGLYSSKIIIKDLVKIIREIRPEIIFTHTSDDIHPDHLATNSFAKDATIVASTELWSDLGEHWITKYFYEFDGLRSQITEPTHIIDITEHMDVKINSLMEFKSQIDRNSNLIDFVKRINSYRGILLNCQYAEALRRVYLNPIIFRSIEGTIDE